MDLHRLLLPRWRIVGRTDLTHEQIGHCLIENMISGFSLYSRKPYYGSFTPQGFLARRPWSRMKTTSFAPSVRGEYGLRDGVMTVTLDVAPHPVWLAMFVPFVAVAGLGWVALIPEVCRTWDVDLLLRGMLPVAAVYGIPWLIFRARCDTDLRFWKQALRLREIVAV